MLMAAKVPAVTKNTLPSAPSMSAEWMKASRTRMSLNGARRVLSMPWVGLPGRSAISSERSGFLRIGISASGGTLSMISASPACRDADRTEASGMNFQTMPSSQAGPWWCAVGGAHR